MARPEPVCPQIDAASLKSVATARVLYADTDKMGIVYHASYLRYLEMARVEFIRGAGVPYSVLEDAGLALPLSELAIRYQSPGLYDDVMTLEVGLSLVTPVRVHFDYRVRVAAGGRRDLAHDLDLLHAQSRHACVRSADARPQRLPQDVFEVLRAHVTAP